MSVSREVMRLTMPAGEPAGEVEAVADVPRAPRGPALILTHGAGGDLSGAGLAALAGELAALGHVAVRFNLPYREAGRSSPPAAGRSVPAYRAAFEQARARLGPRRSWVAGGKSYGGRVASLAVAQGLATAGLLFYGYPLHPPGKPERLRVDHWPAIGVPCLFLQGSRDPFCDLDLLRAHLGSLGAPGTLHVVEGGDHSLRVAVPRAPGGRGRSEREVLAGLAEVVAGWLRGVG